MATIVIDVPGLGPTLFSPVMAHALEPGDLITHNGEPNGLTWRVVAVRQYRSPIVGGLCVRATYDVPGFGDSEGVLKLNEPVLRAVGARAGGVR